MEVWYLDGGSETRYRADADKKSVEAFEDLARAEGYYDAAFGRQALYQHSEVLRQGKKIEFPDLVPRRITLRKPKSAKKLNPHFLRSDYGILISDEARAAVEQLEPETHQFFSVDLVYPDGTISPRQYFLLVVTNRLDALDRAHSLIEIHNPDKENWTWVAHPPKCVFKESTISGFHLWRDPRCRNRLFGSGELVKLLNDQNLRGLEPQGPSRVCDESAV
ncbi:MAG: DUF1629 domain-containing protein [Pseudomonadota bacterium]